MVELNTLLIAGTLAFSAGALITVLIGLLVAIYRNTRKNDDEDNGIYTIPASALMGGPPGGGGGGMGGLMQLYQAAQHAKEAEEAGKKDDKPKADLGGQYL